ncbi:MAG: hypothetical protein HC779_08110, partial [Phyllobacteriaceae bacterium]|nr:hypothetical protein [Phyllobacteriaceae bacterium]
MLKLGYALLLGLVGAIVVHIAIVFILPAVAGGRGHAAVLALVSGSAARSLDPATLAAAGVKGVESRHSNCAFARSTFQTAAFMCPVCSRGRLR